MSQHEAIGIVNAGRWAGVAAGMADFLGRWLESSTSPTIPRGTFAGAHRFLIQVLEGAALDRNERHKPEIPVMAGLSNWTIARDVLSSLPQATRPEMVEKTITKHLECLRRIAAGERDDALMDDAGELKSFFLELLQQGSRKRQLAYAREESPRP